MKVLLIIGTRPNFIKVTRFKEIASSYPNTNLKVVHTGQHYDATMADIFFKQFNLIPNYFLNVGNGSPNFQIAEIMLKLEELITTKFKPNLIIVVGDVNSTLAGALTANKLNIKLAHIESGLRSFDNTMPEEHNRVLTDKICDLYFVTEPSGVKNLKKDNVDDKKIKFVGNTMIDTLIAFSDEIEQTDILGKLKLTSQKFVLTTIHRPATVDFEAGLKKLIQLFESITSKYKVVFPIHPRTVSNLKKFKLYENLIQNENIIITEPLDYFSFQKLIKHSRFIITDSGGIQEESTFLQVPCLTLRDNTERPITCTEGTNTLVKFDMQKINKLIAQIENGSYKKGKIPELWDGHATERIFSVLASL
jgi:UDP-N-acetylglucosamine 2-epimerase (non-hydrolysing)